MNQQTQSIASATPLQTLFHFARQAAAGWHQFRNPHTESEHRKSKDLESDSRTHMLADFTAVQRRLVFLSLLGISLAAHWSYAIAFLATCAAGLTAHHLANCICKDRLDCER